MLKAAFKLPCTAVTAFVLLTLGLFLVSPMPSRTPNVMSVLAYAVLVILSFRSGYMAVYRLFGNRYENRPPVQIHRLRFNLILLMLLAVPLLFYWPRLESAMEWYGFTGVASIFTDLGANYFQKGELIEKLFGEATGLSDTILNLLSFAQIAGFVVLALYWERTSWISRLAGIAAAAVQLLFFLTIGTMSGTFYLTVCIASGVVVRFVFTALRRSESIAQFRPHARRVLVLAGLIGVSYFSLMVVTLSARAPSIVIPTIFKYDSASPIYSVLGDDLADGFGLASSYVAQGWHGLGNDFDMDFQWTYGLSTGRALTAYYYRFAGITDPLPVMSYPVRQESWTGYPAYAFWHTIFPWLASDVTFPGALVMTFLFAFLYGFTWLNAIALRCPISASFFGLLTIGALFMTANSQILDNKSLMLAFFGFLVLFAFRRNLRKIF